MIPSQQETDLSNPSEHFVWALRNLPSFQGVGMLTHSGILKQWSEHLWKCGFAHRDYLERLADADGNIHVSKLPKQTIRLIQPLRGPRHQYNPAARWGDVNDPEPQPMNLPDIRHLTIQENEAMLAQYRAAGMIPDVPPGPTVAEEVL